MAVSSRGTEGTDETAWVGGDIVEVWCTDAVVSAVCQDNARLCVLETGTALAAQRVGCTNGTEEREGARIAMPCPDHDLVLACWAQCAYELSARFCNAASWTSLAPILVI